MSGILTEEELKEQERAIETLWRTGAIGKRDMKDLLKLVTSNRSYLSANAELSFKNQKYKEIMDRLDAHMDFSDQMRSNEVMVFEDVSGINQTFKEAYRLINPEQASINEALEEIK